MHYAGVDIGGTSIKVALVDGEKGIIEKTAFDSFPGDAKRMAGEIAKRIADMNVCAVGIGTAGSVHSDTGLVYASNLNWWGEPFRTYMEEASGLPVWVDNDAQSAMMAETFDGALKNVRNAVYLTFGTGIGGAILIEGRPWRASNNVAAEFGHMVTHADGPQCVCRRRGCYEMYASAPALKRMAGGVEAKDVFALAANGDSAMAAVLQQYFNEVGIGMVNVVSLFNPDVIALGGGVSAAGEAFRKGVEDAFYAQMDGRRDFFKGEFRLAKHRNDAGVLGAAMLAKYHFAEEQK